MPTLALKPAHNAIANRPDDEQYIVRLVGQVITVGLETMKVLKDLPALGA